KDAAGEIVELRCIYDPATRGGNAPDGRKVRGTIHWVAAASAVPAEIRLYNPLFTRPDPGADGDFMADLNPGSLEVLPGAVGEPAGPRPDRAVAASGPAGAQAAVVDGDIAARREIAGTAVVPQLSGLGRSLRYDRRGRPPGDRARGRRPRRSAADLGRDAGLRDAGGVSAGGHRLGAPPAL